MPYSYMAVTDDGKTVRGVSDLASRDAVVQHLESQGLRAVSVDPVRERPEGSGFLSWGFVSHMEKVAFTKHLAIMMKAGLSLLESLIILREQASPGRLRSVITQVARMVEKGQSLSEALSRFPRVFSSFYVNIIRAGETAGTLEGNLEHLAEQFAKDHALRGRVKNALLYPSFVVAAAIAIGFYFALYVIPQISGLFRGLRGIEMPLATRVMVAFATFVRSNLAVLAFGLVLGVVFLIWFLRRRFMRPYVSAVVLHLPFFGRIVRDVNLALFSLVFGTQLKGGISILQALEVTASAVDNWHFRQAILAAAESVRRGNPLSESLLAYPRLFPRLAVRMVEVGERSGRLEEILGFLSDFYSQEVENATKNLTTVMEPVLLVIIGLLALSLAYAIVIPIYNFVGAIGGIS